MQLKTAAKLPARLLWLQPVQKTAQGCTEPHSTCRMSFDHGSAVWWDPLSQQL